MGYKPIIIDTGFLGQLPDAGTLTINGNIDGINYLDFNTSYSDGHSEGRLHWDTDDGTLEIGMPGGTVKLQIGQETIVRVRNVSGNTIPDGAPLYVTGAQANRPTVDLADASDYLKARVVGLATEAIADNSNGYMTMTGLVRDINTATYNEGDLIWLDATPGGWTVTMPDAPNMRVALGYVTRSHSSEGIITINPVIIPRYEIASGVKEENTVEGDFLRWDSVNGWWDRQNDSSIDHGSISGLADDDHPQYTNKTGWDINYAQTGKTTITVNSTARTLTISPTGANFEFWVEGIKYTKTTAQTVGFDDTEGIWFFYFDNTGTLVSSQTPWVIYNHDWAGVCIIYWDSTNKVNSLIGPEYHSYQMDPGTHHYLHHTFGTRWESGLGVAINGDNLDVGAGKIHDEDIEIWITDSAGGGLWQQELTPASMPIFYRSGASDWRALAASTTPVHLISNVPQINTETGGVWGWEDAGVNGYFAYWVVASNDQDTPVVLIPGQESSGTLTGAQDGNKLSDMNFGDLPVVEAKVLARVIIRRQISSPYYQLIEVNDYRQAVDEPSSGGSLVGDHGNLSGLGDNDHPHYVMYTGATTNVDLGSYYLTTTNTVVGSNIPSPTVTDKVLTSTGAGTATWQDPTGGVTDHGALTGLGDNDHTQYVLYTGATDDVDLGSHTLTTTNTVVGSNIPSPTVTAKVLTSTGAGTATWQDPTGGVTDHGALTGLGDNDHTQYVLYTGATDDVDLGSHTLTTTGLVTFTNLLMNRGIRYANSTSVFETYSGADVHYVAASSQVGTLVIDLPAASVSGRVMFKLWGLSDDTTNASVWEVLVGGDTDGTTWSDGYATISGYPPFDTVRLAYNSTSSRLCILLGSVTDTWRYPMMEIERVGTMDGKADWVTNDWAFAFTGSETGITNKHTCGLKSSGTFADPTVSDQVQVSTAAGKTSWLTAGLSEQLTSDENGAVSWEAKPFGTEIPSPIGPNYVLVSTDADEAGWGTALYALTYAKVDNIVIDNYFIDSLTGNINFGDTDLDTTGWVEASNLPRPTVSDQVLVSSAADTAAWTTTLAGLTSVTSTTLTDGTASLSGGSLTDVKLGSLTTNGFVKTSGGDGTLSVDTSTYLTAEVDTLDTVADRGSTTDQILTTGGFATASGRVVVGADTYSGETHHIGLEDPTEGVMLIVGGVASSSNGQATLYFVCPHSYGPNVPQSKITSVRESDTNTRGAKLLFQNRSDVTGTVTTWMTIGSEGVIEFDNITIDAAGISSSSGTLSLSSATSTVTITGTTDIYGIAESIRTNGGIFRAFRNDTGLAATEVVGGFEYYTNDGSTNGAGICGAMRYTCDGTWNGVTNQGHWGIFTQVDGSSVGTLVERMTIDNEGRVVFAGTTGAGNSVTITSGDLVLSSGDLVLSSGEISCDTITLTEGIKYYHGNAAYTYSHVGSDYSGSAGTVGTLVIDLPTAYTNTFQSFKVLGYTYNASYGPWELMIGGYPYNSTPDRWYNYRCSVSGQVPFTQVRLGYNGNTGKACVMLGNTGTAWPHTITGITDLVAASGSPADLESGWVIAYYTDETNFYNNDANQQDPHEVSWNRDFNAPSGINQALTSTGDKTAAWYTTSLANALKTEVPSASGAARKFALTADPGSQFAIVSDPWPETLSADETIYVRTTGNDTTGDGSSGSPFLTLVRTIEYLGGLFMGDYSVVVDIGEGVFNESGTLTFQHPFGSQVVWRGVSEQITSQNTTSIGSTGTSLGFNNLYYYDVTFTLPVGKSVSVGDYIAVRDVSGGTNPQALYGCHYVSGWVSGTRVATVQVVYKNGAPKAAGTVTCTVELIKTVIAFNNKNGLKTSGPYHAGLWEGLVIQGNYSATNTSAKYGVWNLNSPVVSLSGSSATGKALGIVGFQTGLYAQNNALIFADYAFVSRCGTRCTNAQNGGILNLRWARLSGANNNGVYCFNGSTAAAQGVCCVGLGNDSILAYQGSFIDAQSAYVDQNNATNALTADRWSGIDANSATYTDSISPSTPGNNDGSYVIIT